MARQPAKLVGAAGTPTRYIKDMAVGETAYTTPQAYVAEKQGAVRTGRFFIEDTYPISAEKDGAMDVKVIRTTTGYEVDFTESEAVAI